jgi:N-glycosylase/DNA lyase
MIARLVVNLGESHPAQPSWQAFPSAQRLVEAGVEELQSLGLGYRASYLWQIAADVVDGRLALEPMADRERTTEDVLKALLRLRGVGRYAAATILMLLGRYGYLAIDSEMRAMVSRKYHAGAPVSDPEIEERYAPWGDWRYLAYWFDPS